jgi:hypothetical protein
VVDDHHVADDLAGQAERRDEPLDPHPEPGCGLIADQFGGECTQNDIIKIHQTSHDPARQGYR